MSIPLRTELEPERPILRDFSDFMSRMSGSGRAVVERHLTACEKDMKPDHVRLWKRLVGLLGRLTPDALPIPASRAVRFYVPDGKYKLQVFAVEDLRDGNLVIYLDDPRTAPSREGVLTGPFEADSILYRIGGKADDERLSIELLTAAGTTGAPDYYKHMLGWNRSAIRITLHANPSARQVRAAEAICMIAAAAHSAPPAGTVATLRVDSSSA